MKVRIKFAKKGTMKFIGHLDIMRYFQKAIRRAGIDIAYSEGFSPHQIMSFAAPLGVGLESNGEYFDVELNSAESSEAVLNALQQQMVDGMNILEVKELPEKAGNAMASVAAAGYTVYFRAGYEPDFDYINEINSFISQNQIIVTKQTKKSEMELDIRPLIYKMQPTSDQKGIYMLVDASSSGNIKPGLVMEAFCAQHGFQLQDFSLCITREDTYMNKGTIEQPDFVPLGAMGVSF